MSNRYLVIGSNSFSGASFVRHLLRLGHHVVGTSRSEEPHDVMLPYKWDAPLEHFRFVQVDLNKDLARLLATIHDFQPEYIVNFAAQGMVAQSWLAPADWYQTNVVGQVLLHDELRKLKYLKKYVHVTTPEVYGSTDEGWLKETFHFAPSTPYATSRAACDLHLMSFFKAYQFPVCFTRAANVYGPGQQLYRIIPRAMLYARLGKQMQLHGGGHSVRAFIHIDDVAEATVRIAERGSIGESYHISTWEKISIRALVERVCTMTGVPFSSLVQESEDRLGKDQAYLLDSQKIRDELGWTDTIGLDAGLQQTLAWIDDNLDILKTLPADYIHKR
ncbi:GDP-mannose 4,6-dehydratase [Massilia sp. TS11]|uniref:GDP-mannose 4,6-dehydratase n=1 Tax=Massilia sp. TS11 TaxID=2908003 RepID=UPI001EDA050C|nr:GDP-mannose 4,6-dehydratase [Massilia sp. TS11]MCG2586650.1 GDP-mannose 4,6-dehydratase [Massilia sp. TS11]